MSFDEKNIEALVLGELIKRQRESKNISIKELSEQTGISVNNLKNLEVGNYNNLPSDIYVESFVVKCEQTLGFENGKLLTLYQNERKSSDRNQTQEVSKMSTRSFTITPKVIGKFFVAFLALFVVIYFGVQLSYLLGAPKLVVITPESDIITELNVISVSGTTQPDNKVTINNNDIFIDREGSFSETVPLQDGVNTIEIKSTNRFGKESIIIRRVMLNLNH